MALDTDKIDEAVLALLYLTLHDHWRAWKGFDWDALNRLYQKGLIDDPVNKAKSVVFTEEGLKRAEELFSAMFTKPPDNQIVALAAALPERVHFASSADRKDLADERFAQMQNGAAAFVVAASNSLSCCRFGSKNHVGQGASPDGRNAMNAGMKRRTVLGGIAGATSVASFAILTEKSKAAEFVYKIGNDNNEAHP